MEERFPWSIIEKYFNDNPNYLVSHHLDSYNSFFDEGIKRIFKEKNPIRIMKEQNSDTNEFGLKCDMYLGGKNGDKLYYGKPVIYDDSREHFMYPNEARLRNMTYGITIHYDVEVDFFIRNTETDEIESETIVLEKIFLGRFPIMLQSDLCILNGLDKQIRFQMGECRNDKGGYFIIDGKEKCIVCQEKFGDNMIYIRDKQNNIYSHSAEIRSVSEDASKPIRTLSIRIVAPSNILSNNQIVVIIPNVRKPVPLFILMRALGINSDRDIIDYCLLDREKYNNYVDLFIPSIHDAGRIFNQEIALKYIAMLTKGKTIPHALEILTNYLLPHIGEMNFNEKAYFIGYMTKQLLQVYMKEMKPTDRDNFQYKRIELTGSLIYDLFKEYYTLQQRNIFQRFDKEYYFKSIYKSNFKSLIESNYTEFFGERIVESGFRKAFKGNWGSESHTKREGVIQDVNRLSYNSFISQMRKLNLPLDASAKIVGPRLAHTTQWGIIDPIDTPDGGNVGLHKNLTIMASITKGYSSNKIIQWVRKHCEMMFLSECTPIILSNLCKVVVNGQWVGVIANPFKVENEMKSLRRVAVIPTFTSIYWNIKNNTLFIYTDAGRICRPIFYSNKHIPSYANEAILEKIKSNDFTWEELVSGLSKKKDLNFKIKNNHVYDNVSELYNVTSIKQLSASFALLDYLDTSETEGALIAMDYDIMKSYKIPYTHIEIHPSLMLGVMGNQVIFPENNQLPRDLFACGQSRQAVSLYHTNYQVRVDKTGIVLNNGQVPLVKSRYLQFINNEEHPCGENTIVAIMSFNGYNVEDSILFNEGSLKRGLFRTTYFSVYESREEVENTGNNTVNTIFSNIENKEVIGMKPGCDYSKLDKHGLIKENEIVDEKTVLIGKVSNNIENSDVFIDASSFPKKGQLGYVDKSFMTEGDEGMRIAKVRIRNERIPNIGDKFCSRCGQKGTVGLVIPEADMPFTSSGLKPDIIINPHAIPSRMTIGQLIESIMGKACSMQGAFGDCTAFVNNSDMPKIFGNVLTNNGFHSSGNDVLYNGQTGEQIQTEIFMGPTYYMRLKHMVKDKINYRAQGPRTSLTRQPVQGRANDGGLRIGEMERDGLISHGVTKFLQESMLERGDDYYMAICNKTGTIAVYNEDKNLFISPQLDGPIEYTGTISDNINIQTITKYGRSFSIVRVPYAFKLMMQELTTMNVQMRIITEDNIDQITNLSFSDNIQKLTNKDIDNLSISKGIGLDKSKMPSNKQSITNVSELGFTKIQPPPFKKWRISKLNIITANDLSPLPSSENRNFVTLEPSQENLWFKLNDEINAAKSKLDDIPSNFFPTIAGSLDMYSKLRNIVQKQYNMENATNAALKMYELINQMNLLNTTNGNCLPIVNAFCNAELPGAFIIAINHYMRTKCITSEFDWIASSYLPDAAMKIGNTTILEDRFKIYERNRTHWLMGPIPNGLPDGETPISGDVTDSSVITTLSNTSHVRFANNDKTGATLYTSDVGIEINQDELNRQEELTSFVNFGQILTGLLSLSVGGNFVTKQFTFITPFSRSLIAIVASLFDECYITKPKTSRPANSEVYLVAKGFNGISSELSSALLERCEIFKSIDNLPTTWGSLLNPELLSQVDADILAAAQEVHGEQQVDFLNEISNVNSIFSKNISELKKITTKYETESHKTWLNENSLSVIPSDENLNNQTIDNSTINTIEPSIDDLQKRRIKILEELKGIEVSDEINNKLTPIEEEDMLENESILIPEDNIVKNDEENDDNADENTEEDKQNTKKTISFNIK